MKKAQPEVVPVKVLRVQKNFARWRTEKKQEREPIPLRLWTAAATLCKTHSLHRISRWLRIDYAKLKNHTRKATRTSLESARSTFVEWSPPAGVLPGSSAAYIVELPDREGGVQRIHVRGTNVTEVAALSRALRSSEG